MRQQSPRSPRSGRETQRRNRQARYRKGWVAEVVAALFLMGKGYRILNWRFRSAHGEIDLVARRRKVVAFVEVKARNCEEDALRSVSVTQKNRMFGAADFWMKTHAFYQNYDRSFDLVAVVPWKGVFHHQRFFSW